LSSDRCPASPPLAAGDRGSVDRDFLDPHQEEDWDREDGKRYLLVVFTDVVKVESPFC